MNGSLTPMGSRTTAARLKRVVPTRIRMWVKGLCIVLAQKLMPARFGRAGEWPVIVPAWVCGAMRVVSRHEPDLAPEGLLPYLAKTDAPADCRKTSRAYTRLWASINKGARHVFVLGKADGGVRQSLLPLISRLACDEGHAVTVVCDGFAKGEVEACAPDVECVELGDVMETGDATRQAIVLGRALMEVGPATICVASSEVAWAMFGMMAPALAECSTLYAELPDLVARSDNDTPMAAERFVAHGLSGFVKLVARSEGAASRWAERYGVECVVAGTTDAHEVPRGA